MSLRRAAFLLSFLALSACGFSPIYGAREKGRQETAAALSQVAIENIPNEDGQKLRNKLMDRMYFHGRPQKPAARLVVTLSSGEEGLGIQKDATASLSELTLTAPYKLLDDEGEVTLKGTAVSVVTYDKLEAQYGTLAAGRNAKDRAIAEVAEQIVSDVSLYYAQLDAPASKNPADAPKTTQDKSWFLQARPVEEKAR